MNYESSAERAAVSQEFISDVRPHVFRVLKGQCSLSFSPLSISPHWLVRPVSLTCFHRSLVLALDFPADVFTSLFFSFSNLFFSKYFLLFDLITKIWTYVIELLKARNIIGEKRKKVM